MIDYSIIADSNKFYEDRGYARIESPWTVTKEVSEITKPVGAREFQLVHENNKVLVASGEQSFLYLYLKEFLPKGKFQTTTPCFRFEKFDTFHTKYFVKTELIQTDKTTEEDLIKVINDSWFFFAQYFPAHHLHIKKQSNGSYDIQFHDIELGSYGIRSCDFLTWIYGTGVAEPRMSQTMRKYGLPHKRN